MGRDAAAAARRTADQDRRPGPEPFFLADGFRWAMLGTILLVVLILLLLVAVPAWPHSRGWGYGPSGILGVLLVVLIVLLLLGVL